MGTLPRRVGVKCLPNHQLGLTCLCISGAVILQKKSSSFQPRSLCSQLEVTKEDVVALGNEQPLGVRHPQAHPTSRSAHGRVGRGKRGMGRGQIADPENQLDGSSFCLPENKVRRMPRVFADS